jgi:hypothetical protein
VIQVNMLDVSKQRVNEAVAKALQAIRNRSYAGRHPELGKMVNCPVCDRRHRGSICAPIYAVGRYALEKTPLIASQETYRGVYGAHSVAKKRFNPHPNVRGLKLLARTRDLFPSFFLNITDPKACMKAARAEAIRQLRAEEKEERRKERNQTKLSRRINRGLAKPTDLFRFAKTKPVSTTAKNKRQDKQAIRTLFNATMREAVNGGSVSS